MPLCSGAPQTTEPVVNDLREANGFVLTNWIDFVLKTVAPGAPSIPKGYHIHHKDHDLTNNDIDNLECLTAAEHRRHHAPELPFETSLANPKHGAKAQAAAAAALRRYKRYICKGCGIRFKARSFKAQFCSTKCGERYRHKSKPRICKRCGTKFWRGTATSWGPCSKQFIRRVYELCSKPFKAYRPNAPTVYDIS